MRRAVLTLVMLGAGPAWAEPRSFVVVPEESRITVDVGKAGLFKFAGHAHEVVTGEVRGTVVADAEALAASRVELEIPADRLRVTGKGEPADDVPRVQEKMLGPEVLDVARFALVRFRSTRVEGRALAGGAFELELQGELELHGVKRALTLPVRVELSGDALVASGTLELRQSDYGMKPVSVAGVVKVRDQLALSYKIVGRLQR